MRLPAARTGPAQTASRTPDSSLGIHGPANSVDWGLSELVGRLLLGPAPSDRGLALSDGPDRDRAAGPRRRSMEGHPGSRRAVLRFRPGAGRLLLSQRTLGSFAG